MNLNGKYELLSDIVYNTIKEAIISGDLEAETKISETKLAKELGVSRTPVREALRLLSVEGFVRLQPNSSFVVNSFSEEDAFEIMEVRRLLEAEAARLAAKRIDDNGRKVLKDLIDFIQELEQEQPEDKARRFTETDIDFHKKIYKLCGNTRLAGLGDMLHDRQARLHLAGEFDVPSVVQEFHNQHKEIAKAIMDGNEEMAEKLARNHIDYVASMMK